MPETTAAYRALATVAPILVRLGSLWSEKLAVGDQGRRTAIGRWQAWAAAHRDWSRPLVWFHAPSVGEGLQAEEVLRHLRIRQPDWQLVYSYFSPSAVALAARQPVDFAEFLPYDTPANGDRLLAALKPDALVFAKLDLWPELACRAHNSGVKVGMIAATVSPVSGRLHPIAQWFTRPGYASLDRVGAIDRPDAERLTQLGCPAANIEVTGDPRFDSAARRAATIAGDDPIHRLTADQPTLVAGSTWRQDEVALLAAFAQVRSTHPTARLVLVPHEPTETHLAQLRQRAATFGLAPARFSELATSVPSLVVVDRVGVLATLYAKAAIGFVGGGFGAAGLHSVLEPAACGIPVLFGPRWQASREAGLLVAARAGYSITAIDPVKAADELASVWRRWLDDPASRQEAGRAARQLIERGQGAGERSADLVIEMLHQPTRSW